MPTYVYKFIDTGETIEVRQSFTDDTLTEYAHPQTGARMPVKKVFLPVGVTFKGDGFYKTDSRSGSTASTSTSKGGGDGDGGSSGEGSGSSSSSSSDAGGSSETSTSSATTSTSSSTD